MTKEKVGSAGRFGARYGKKIRTRVIAVENKQKLKHKCPNCLHFSIKRLSSGIYYCKKCKIKFGSGTYFME